MKGLLILTIVLFLSPTIACDYSSYKKEKESKKNATESAPEMMATEKTSEETAPESKQEETAPESKQAEESN